MTGVQTCALPIWFNLSLFGFDPDGDYHRVTREQAGRRINLAVPEASLLVEKAVGAVPHTGGKLFDIDSVRAADLIDWIGGYPFEVAKPCEIVNHLVDSGFELTRLTTLGGGSGCNEYVFTRAARS